MQADGAASRGHSIGHAPVVAHGGFAVNEQAETLLERECIAGGGLELLGSAVAMPRHLSWWSLSMMGWVSMKVSVILLEVRRTAHVVVGPLGRLVQGLFVEAVFQDGLDRTHRARPLELIRIRGHLTLWGGGIHHAEIKTAVRAGVPAPDG